MADDLTHSATHWLEGVVRQATGATTPAAAVTSLTGAFGTPGDAIADVGGAFAQATLNNNFRALEDKVNTILVRLRALGLIS